MTPHASNKTYLPSDVSDTEGLIAALGGNFYAASKSMLYHKTRELMAEVVRLRAAVSVIADVVVASVSCNEGDGCLGDNCLRCYVLIASGRPVKESGPAEAERPGEDVADLPSTQCPLTRCDWGGKPSAGDRCLKCGTVATGDDRRIWRARERIREFNERQRGWRA